MCEELTGGIDIHIVNNQVTDKERIIGILDNFQQEFQDTHFVIDDEALDKIKKKLSRCRREFDSNRFFVLVVGPVKSGKSTFVNILTRSSLCPTDVLECTALPTIIGKSDNPGYIKCYIPNQELDGVGKCELFDEIIDVLRGIELPAVLNGKTRIDESKATNENVGNVVTNPDNFNNPMLATIGIEGTDFMDDQVMLIDMPGLDGMSANDRDPLYRKMVQRADFIFFVQSSTSAINEATNDFLIWLLDNNLNAVPFRLIHNLHDSHYFLKADIRQEIVNRQLKNGRQCIRDTFHIRGNFDSYVMNFAKIFNGLMANDVVEGNHLEDVNMCAQEYRETERDILQRMMNQRQIIKDQNNIAKSSTQLHESIVKLNEIKDKITLRKQKINEMLQMVPQLDNRISAQQIRRANIRANVTELIRNQAIENDLQLHIQNYQINVHGRMSGTDLKTSIKTMAETFSSFTMLNTFSAFYAALCNIIQQEFVSIFGGEIDVLAATIRDIAGNDNFRNEIQLLVTTIHDNLENPTLVITLDYSSLPSSISFIPNYYNINEYCVNFMGIRIRNYYSQQDSNRFLSMFKEECNNKANSLINGHIDNVINAVNQIRDRFVTNLVKKIETKKQELFGLLNAEFEGLTNQDTTIDRMLQVLNGEVNE